MGVRFHPRQRARGRAAEARPDGDTRGANGPELRYAISDLGATLGDTGKWPLLWRFTRSRNDPKGFGSDKLIDEVKEGGRVDFEFSGKKRDIFNNITAEEARWLGGILSRLSDRQIADAFRAANYAPPKCALWRAQSGGGLTS